MVYKHVFPQLIKCKQHCHLFISVCLSICVRVCDTHLYPTLCYPMDCNSPGSSVHGILQARILEWVATVFSRGSSQPRDQTWVSCIAGRFFTIWANREALICDHISTDKTFKGLNFLLNMILSLIQEEYSFDLLIQVDDFITGVHKV